MSNLNPKDQAAKAEGKARLDLLDLDALTEVAAVLEFGAVTKGYGVQNYAVVPIEERTYAAATLRHLRDRAGGEDVAPDSGLNHWAHIAANAIIVLKAILAGTLIDNRGPGPVGPNPINDAVRERVEAIVEEDAEVLERLADGAHPYVEGRSCPCQGDCIAERSAHPDEVALCPFTGGYS